MSSNDVSSDPRNRDLPIKLSESDADNGAFESISPSPVPANDPSADYCISTIHTRRRLRARATSSYGTLRIPITISTILLPESEGAVEGWSGEGDDHSGAESDDESADLDTEYSPDQTTSNSQQDWARYEPETCGARSDGFGDYDIGNVPTTTAWRKAKEVEKNRKTHNDFGSFFSVLERETRANSKCESGKWICSMWR